MVMTLPEFDRQMADDVGRQLDEEAAQIDAMLGRKKPAAEPDIGSAVDAYLKNRGPVQQVQTSMALSAGTDSDYEAELRRLSAKTGVPLESARAFPDDVKKRAQLNSIDYNDLAHNFPETTKFLGNLNNARIAHDDVEALRGVENALRAWDRPDPTFGSVLSGLGEAAKFKPLVSGLKLGLHDMFFDDGSPEAQVRRADLMRQAGRAQAQQDNANPAFETSTAQGLYSGLVSTVQAAPGIAASIATGNPLPALGMAGVQSGAPAYAKYLDRGATKGQAALGALGEGSVEVATELLPMSFLVNKFGKVGFGQFLTGMLAREVPTEQVATHVQDAIDTAIANPDKTWGEYAAERPDAAYQTLLATLVQSGAIGAISTVSKQVAKRSEKAGQAGQQAGVIEQLTQAAQASKVLQRDPETFQKFIAEATENGPVQQVYIDANTLMQSGVAEQLAAISPAVNAQLSEAMATGGQVAIPVEEYAARIAPTELAPGLLDHLRVDPDGYSRSEAQVYLQTFGESLKTEVEQVLADKRTDAAFAQSADAVKTTIKTQLDTAARFTPQVNDAYAALVGNFYAVNAAKTGTTPEALYQRYPLTVAAESVAGPQFDQAATDATDGPFGPVLTEFRGNAQGAIAKLMETKSGEAVGALNHPDIGDIDLVWGEEGTNEHNGYGLSKLVRWHPEVVDDLQGIIGSMRVASRSANRAQLESDHHKGAVRLQWDNQAKHWLLTAFEKDESAAGTRTDTTGVEGWDGSPTLASDPIVEQAMREFYQGRNAARGTFNPETLQISLLKNADLSTFLHESAHFFLEVQADMAAKLQQEADTFGLDTLQPGERQILADHQTMLDWFGVRDMAEWHALDFEEKRSYHEKFAEGFETYLFEGMAPSIELNGLFQRFRDWMVGVYKSLKAMRVELSPEVRSVFDRLIATDEQIALAQYGRSMMPLFTAPEQAGMTVESFAAYQALGKEATADAKQELASRGLRDMQWLRNTHGREVKKLQRQSKELRASVQAAVRSEVMRQPVYRAWTFLTGRVSKADALDAPSIPKSNPDVLDESIDSLYVAIAKLGGLNKAEVQQEWGIEDKPESGVFGKPVWRKEGGKTLDGMAEALAEVGYLTRDQHGKADMREFEEKFAEELNGRKQYSNAVNPAVLQAEQRPGDQIANPGGLTAGRLDRGALRDMDIQTVEAELLKERRMTADNGLHPDIVAELFGFTSGDHLLTELVNATPPRDVIDAMTDQRMMEQYGDLSSPEAIERAADRAIHNDTRARMVATEANALAKATGQKAMLNSAAKQFARDIVSRLKVRSIRPGQYASAEVRAAKAAEKASKSGDLSLAAAEKRNQLINTYATRAAYEAQEEVDRGLRYLKRLDSEGTRKNLDADYVEQIDNMLERFDLRKGESLKAIDKRKKLADWLTAQRDAGFDPDIPEELENEAFRKSYKDMTVEEFRGLVDTVKQIEHLARLKHKLLTAKDEREFRAIVDEVSNSIVANGGKERPVELETPTGVKPWLEGFQAGHRKVASLVRQMDGGRDNGPFWRVFVRAMNERATQEAVMVEDATMRLAELYKPILALKGGANGDAQYIPEINASLTRGGRLSVALNWGNAANRQRILDGDRWTPAQVNAILGRLTRAEWDFVQNTWAFVDSYWPQIAAKERRVTGREPEKVEAAPFSVTLGDGSTLNLSGGYYPIKYDANRDDRAEKLDAAELAKDMMRGAMTRSTTRRGHTKQRAEQVKRPVRKDLSVLTQHIAQVTHDLAWHEWLIDANRIINAGPVNEAIRAHYGTEVVRTLKDALTAIATADVIPQTKIDQALMHLRANVSRSTMGLSLTTAFLQPFGLTQSMARIGPKHVMRGLARWAGDAARMESSVKWIQEKSEFMRLRNKTFNRELHEINGRVNHGQSQARQIYDASLFMLMRKMQMLADVPTWIGAYEKARAEGHDDALSVSLADQSVLDSQGGGQTKDMAEFQRKHPFLTMFYSYFSTTLNLAAESTAKTDFKNPMAVAGWASDMALLMVIPALGPAMILSFLRGEDACEELESCAAKMVKDQTGYLLNTMIGVRELSGSVAGYDYAGPPIGRVVTELGRVGTQIKQGEADEGLARSAISLMGVALGIPTTQILRSWKGWNAWADGDAPATSILLGPPQKD